MYTKWLFKLNIFDFPPPPPVENNITKKFSTVWKNKRKFANSGGEEIYKLYDFVWKYFEGITGQNRKKDEIFPHTKGILNLIYYS